MFSVACCRLLSLCSKSSLYSVSYNVEVISKYPIQRTIVRFQHFNKSGSPPGSRYAPVSPREEIKESIQSALKDKNSLTDEEWEEFKSDIFYKGHFVSEENFSSIIMHTLLASNQLKLGHSFLKFVENSSVKPNFLTYLQYIALCSRNHKDVDQEVILKILDKVRKQIDLCPVLDIKRAEYVIQGLCATDKWRESFQYLDKLVNIKPNREICNALACAAMRNNDEKLAWEILLKWMNPYESVNDRVVEEFLLVALKKQKINFRESDVFIEKLFNFMQVRDVIISLKVTKLIEQYFTSHRLKWKITYTKLSRKGVCENCYQNLQLFELKDKDFEDLREAFLQRAVMKSDLFYNTNKTEFAHYMKFIDANKPFHIVLDGLNAAYSYPGHVSRKSLSIQLWKIVKKMSGSYRKVLVLGRKHMKTWPGIEKISGRAKLFFTDNTSQDDPFLIYAALASGPYTLFLSGDLMRDHLSRLDDLRLIHLFKRWQLSHQMFIKADNKDISFVEPVRHSITVQGTMEHGWHIPFDDKIILDPYEELNNWMCIQKIM